MVTNFEVKPSPFANGRRGVCVLPPREDPSQDEILQGFKALFDELKSRMDFQLDARVKSLVFQLGKGDPVELVSGLEKRVKDNVIQGIETKLQEIVVSTVIRMVGEMEEKLNERVNTACQAIKDAHEAGLEQFKVLLESMPAPIVKVGKEAFNLKVDQPAPNIQVNVPKSKKVEKSLFYDEYNRPIRITEREVE